jgi:hypothetical protein
LESEQSTWQVLGVFLLLLEEDYEVGGGWVRYSVRFEASLQSFTCGLVNVMVLPMQLSILATLSFIAVAASPSTIIVWYYSDSSPTSPTTPTTPTTPTSPASPTSPTSCCYYD